MTEHTIAPPPELMQQWANAWHTGTCTQELLEYIATQAARWGADQELEACCEVLARELICDGKHVATDLRAVRRPEPSSKKHRALKALSQIEDQFLSAELAAEIRCALEGLPDD